MADYASMEKVKAVSSDSAPYPPSWVDRLLERRRTSRFRPWVWYARLGLSIYLILAVIVWLEGSSPFGTLSVVGYDGAGYVVIYLALMHYLDGVAQRAFDSFRPFLAGLDEGESERLCYELTTMPAQGTLLAGGCGLLGTGAGLLLLHVSGLGHLIPVPAAELLILFLGNFMIGTYLYHTVRQLRVVSRIHDAATRVNLFRREPAYAFSRLTARTGASWVLAFTLGVVPRITLELGERYGPYGPLAWYPMLTAALLAFVLPLLSMRRLLRAEKRRVQAEVNVRLETMLTRLNERIDGGLLAEASDFKVTLDSLLIERDLVSRIPTWPWNVGTLAGYLSTILLPLLIWLLQQLLSGLFTGN